MVYLVLIVNYVVHLYQIIHAIRAKPTPNGKKIQKCYNITKNVSEIWHVLVDNSLYNHGFRVNICDKYTMEYNKS